MSTFDDPKVGEVWEDTKHSELRPCRPFRIEERRADSLRVTWTDTNTAGGVTRHAFRDPDRFRVARRPS